MRVVLPVVSLLLFGLPWWQLVLAPHWNPTVSVLATVLGVLAVLALPTLMARGHGRRQSDGSARVGDLLLGVVWVVFTWTVLGQVLRLALLGIGEPTRSRVVALSVLAVAAGLCCYGLAEALRLPRVRRREVVLPRLGAGMDGLRLVAITDTHFGPLDRTGWARRVAEAVEQLDPHLVCHTGDLADGAVARRCAQVRPLHAIRAEGGKFYITGNHEYFGDAQGWLDHMGGHGWLPLHNRHQVVAWRGERLVLAGVDDPTGAGSGLPGHGPDLPSALAGVDPELPVILLAHQPKQVSAAQAAGVDLQISGHTHGGQIWPFHYLVRTDQPSLSGLSRHGAHTQLYTSRGTGFWGPPLRLFAPSEITLLTLRTPKAGRA